ncbi:NAD(P)-binding domain-containing protein [Paenibacillus sp. BC26]|uniref:NAD(P)-binding domain-containing protein n=1 Tax=Paenibacillus sp. BC26 TaxID=1881032 RepID=UPI0008E0724B|nr:NAD(P)-binding domain-containing protein [Paenibacillus sp. BC26]SFT05353.1 Lysine/ornithine N-monooxygenase [Paenibacillus sp. BC26]
MVDLAIIGAGPYGISLAAHAKAAGLSYALLGQPMHFWKEQMPQTMFIRTNPLYISLSDSEDRWTIARFCEETGTPLVSPFPRPAFVEYAFWFAHRAGIAFTSDLAAEITRSSHAFDIVTRTGSHLSAARIIVATGLQHFSYVPKALRSLPPSLLTHTFGQTSFDRFHGRSVAVVGSGQSAWEAAALLHLAGCDAELLFRGEKVRFSGEDNAASGLRLIESAEQFYRQPHEEKQERWNTPRRGSVALFLKPYVEGKVKATGSVEIVRADVRDDGKAQLALSNGETRAVDHVVSATGYRINLDNVPFLAPELSGDVLREPAPFHGFPLLSEHFESSIPGLYFAGPLASHTHGPAFGFIAGLNQTCRSIIPHIVGMRNGSPL